MNGWEGVSGWDFAKKQPKSMKKLVRPGAVYLIEIKDVNQSSDIAKYLWGCNLFSKKMKIMVMDNVLLDWLKLKKRFKQR